MRIIGFVALLLFAGSLSPILAQGNLRLLTSVAEVKRLSDEQALQGYPVRLRGIVRFCDPSLSVLSVQDSTGGTLVQLKSQGPALTAGQWIEVEGISSRGSFLPYVSKAQFKPINPQTAPPLRTISLKSLDLRKDDGQWVQVDGIVHNLYQEGTYAVLEVYDRNQKVQVYVQNYSKIPAGNLIDATVRIQGVLAVIADASGQLHRLVLWVPKAENIQVQAPLPLPSSQIPITPISSIYKTWQSGPPIHRIRIQGAVLKGERVNGLQIRDKSGMIPVQALFTRPIAPGDEVDAVGFADFSSRSPKIINANFLRIKASAIESSEEKGLPLLTQISQIRQLSAKEAARGYPVKIRGAITFHNPQLSMTFIQDKSGAIYIQSLNPVLALNATSIYEVTGFSAPGDYAPVIVKPKFRILGPATLPEAVPLTFNQLATGKYDCLRVQVKGVVLSIQQIGNRWLLKLFNDGKTIQVWISNPEFGSSLSLLQDAAVRVQGVCSIQISEWGNISGFKVNVSSLEDVQIEEREKFEPLLAPLHTIQDAYRSSGQSGRIHRIRIEGELLHQRPDKALYLRDATGTMEVSADTTLPLKPGDVLAASGYVMPGDFAPTLEYALIKRVNTGPKPAPKVLRDAQELNSHYHGNLIRIRARLVDQWRSPDGRNFILQDLSAANTAFEAILENSNPDETESAPPNGSELELSGISLLYSKGTQKYGFRLLLRSPDDIHIIKRAPWWNLKHTIWVIGALLVTILLALAWAAMLKVRINKQTRIIKQRLEIEAALERKYRELFEELHDIVFTCDQSGRLQSINPAASRILGYSMQELLNMDSSRLIAPESLAKIRGCFEQRRQGTKSPTLECELLSKDNRPIPMEISGEILYSNGQFSGARGIARDITERKNAEEALRSSEERLRQAQKMEAIGNLAGGIAHDFNNILVAILGFAELSALEIPPGHPVASNLEQITKAAKRARNVVQQILAFSRKMENERHPIHLQGVLEEALHLIKATLPATIEITTKVDPACPPVMSDSTQMHQIILNLVTNAAHALKDGGTLHIELAAASKNGSPAHPFPERATGEYVCLTVKDTGPGIDPQIQAQIFEPYFTTKSVGEGSGLGLAVVHGIVESHGGAIQLISDIGEGACFHIFLPGCKEQPVMPQNAMQTTNNGNGRILIVDDEEAIVMLGRRSLTRLGYKVTGETSSVRALELFAQDPQQFDLIVTDQTMPQLTGLSLAQEIWKIRPNIPIIISTGYSDQVTPESTATLGFHALLGKPYTTSELSQTIQRCLSE